MWSTFPLPVCFNAGEDRQVDAEASTPATSADETHPYFFTRETRRMTRDKVTPDYAAVLVVCSRYLGVSPIQLHSEVAQLESEMIQVESTTSASGN